MEKLKALVVVATMTVMGASASLAQTSTDLKDLHQAIEALTESQKAIRQDLQEIKNLLRARPTPAPAAPAPAGDEDLQNVMLSVDGAAFKGEKNARLTLIDFTDYQ